MTLRKVRKGDQVRIRFFDHSCGLPKPVEAICWGKIYKQAKTYIVLSSWEIEGVEQDLIDHNREVITIIKSAIIEIIKLKDSIP